MAQTEKKYLPSIILFVSPEPFVKDGTEYRIKVRQSVADDGTIGRPLRELIAKGENGYREFVKSSWEPDEDEAEVIMGLMEDIMIAKVVAAEPTKYGGQKPTPKPEKKSNGNAAAAIREAANARSAALKANLVALGSPVFPTFPAAPARPAETVSTPATPAIPNLKVKQGRGGK